MSTSFSSSRSSSLGARCTGSYGVTAITCTAALARLIFRSIKCTGVASIRRHPTSSVPWAMLDPPAASPAAVSRHSATKRCRDQMYVYIFPETNTTALNIRYFFRAANFASTVSWWRRIGSVPSWPLPSWWVRTTPCASSHH